LCPLLAKVAHGTYTLNGGALSVSQILNGAGTSTFNINGGTLSGAWTTLAVDNFNVGSSGSFTLADGKTLKAANITTTGILNVDGSITDSDTMNVSSGGTLKGAGTLYDLVTTIDDGGILSPGASPGILTISDG
jgi:hypothetical protein